MIDGQANDGGPVRQFGWGRVPAELQDVRSESPARVATRLFGELKGMRIYPRALMTQEAVGNFRACMKPSKSLGHLPHEKPFMN